MKYEGEVNDDGAPHGQGIYYFASGDRYEGEWKDGKKHIERKVRLRIVPLLVEYFEDFGEALIMHSKEKPVSFPRIKRKFDEEIEEALLKTEFIPSRHAELLETKGRIEELLGLKRENSESANSTGVDWV